MAEINETVDQESRNAEDNGTQNEEQAQGQVEETSPSSTDDLPEWARKQISKANREAASYRTQLREIEEKFQNAMTEAELEATLKPLNEQLSQSEARTRDLERQLVIYKHGLDEELEEFITGDDPTSWEAQAKKLAALKQAQGSTADPGSLRGRFGNRQRPEDDPASAARSVFLRHRD